MPFERLLLVRFAAPPEILIEAIYRLGVAGIAVFEERPQYFAPPPQLELERDIEALRGLLGRFALSATPRPPRGGHLADIIRRYLEALRRCVAEYEPEDVVGREAAKRVVMRCLTEGGISLEEVVGVLNVAEQVIETYKRSAYSEGLDTGKNFTSMAAEIAAKEEEARRMGMLCSFLEWLEREGYSVVRIPRGYRILLEPREEIKEPHQVLELGGFRLAFVAGGREDYGGVEVPREYLLDIGTSRILLRQSIENIKSSIELLKNIAKNMDNIYRNYSAFGDYRWEEHAGTAAIALYVRERDAARLDEILSGVLSGVYVPRGLVGYRAGAVYKLVRTPVSERWPYPIQAFARILYMYGVPGPGEISPLPLVALLFPLFYGWMFGDVGYGLLLLLMSLVLFKMGRKDWAVIWLITAASTIAFGLYYGDFLGLKIWGRAMSSGSGPPRACVDHVLGGRRVLVEVYRRGGVSTREAPRRTSGVRPPRSGGSLHRGGGAHLACRWLDSPGIEIRRIASPRDRRRGRVVDNRGVYSGYGQYTELRKACDNLHSPRHIHVGRAVPSGVAGRRSSVFPGAVADSRLRGVSDGHTIA